MKIKSLVEAKYIGEKSFEVFLNKYFDPADQDDIDLFGPETFEADGQSLFKLNDQLMGKFKVSNREYEFRYIMVFEHSGINYVDLYDEDAYDIYSELREDVFQKSIGIFEKPKQLYP